MKGKRILIAVSEQHGATMDDLLGRSRLPSLVNARRDAALRMRAVGYSGTKIANLLKRDPSTIDLYLYPNRRAGKRRWVESRAEVRV